LANAVTRVALVSTSPAVRAGLRALLASAGDVVIVAESPTLQVGILEALDVPPDVVVLDAPSASSLDDLTDWMDGVDVGLLVLGPADGLERLLALAPAFAWGYLARESGPAELAAAIEAVAAGLTVLEPGLLGHFTRDARPSSSIVASTVEDLTQRERETLQLVAEGLTNKAIAVRLAISDHTVKFHVASILAKLGAGSRTEAVHLAARQGLIAL
jgi:DNA-binding NarL/FixJ family response regulator